MSARIGLFQCLPSKMSNPRGRGSCDHGGSRNPGIMGPRARGILKPWDPGMLRSWEPGVLESWGAGILRSRGDGALESWDSGMLGSWDHGALGPWDFGNTGSRGPKILESWGPGITGRHYFQALGAGAIWTFPVPRRPLCGAESAISKRLAQAQFEHCRCLRGHYKGPNWPFPTAWRRRNLGTFGAPGVIIKAFRPGHEQA